MGKPLRVLLVEDCEADALLLVRELQRGGYTPEHVRVDTAPALETALAQPWDVVLSDYLMPGFSAPAALRIVQQLGGDVPFLIVSGALGEETAVQVMKAGAHDFVPKDKLARLVPAIERELREVAMRREQRVLRQQLLVSDRLASIGTLATGVAHELNNPLAVVMANMEFVAATLRAEPGISEELVAALRDALDAAERMRMIVRDLRVFSRPDEERMGPVDLRPVIESTLRMAWHEFRHRATVEVEHGDVPAVIGNEARLGQVLLNLLINAAHAMPQDRADGVVRVRTALDEAGRVELSVTDTGSGIPADILGRIFDPLFTTKPRGVGTGLGLAICHRIVASLGGEITVDSQAGSGTTFHVFLPAAD